MYSARAADGEHCLSVVVLYISCLVLAAVFVALIIVIPTAAFKFNSNAVGISEVKPGKECDLFSPIGRRIVRTLYIVSFEI